MKGRILEEAGKFTIQVKEKWYTPWKYCYWRTSETSFGFAFDKKFYETFEEAEKAISNVFQHVFRIRRDDFDTQFTKRVFRTYKLKRSCSQY